MFTGKPVKKHGPDRKTPKTKIQSKEQLFSDNFILQFLSREDLLIIYPSSTNLRKWFLIKAHRQRLMHH